MEPYVRLLQNPCSGSFARPPYSGTDSGYMLRTTEYLNIQSTVHSGMVVGAATTMDFAIQINPSSYSGTGATSGLIYGAAPVNTAFALTARTSQSFIAQNAAVRKFRCIAGCLKVIPNGPYTGRQGTIGLASSSGMLVQPSAPVQTGVTYTQQTLELAATGSKDHEVLFIPASEDETWNDPGVGDVSSYAGGTMFAVGVAVDGVALSATVAQALFVVEVTLVWEWIPATGQGLSVMPTAPSPHTLQSVLSKISDIGSFALNNRHVRNFATQAAAQAVTQGYRNYSRRGPNIGRVEHGEF